MAYLNYSQKSAIESCLAAIQHIVSDVNERSSDAAMDTSADDISALYSSLNVARDCVDNLSKD